MGRATRQRRRSVRRAVALDCALQSDQWDDVVHLPASNLSTDGIWIEAPLSLDPGEELIVSFTPPGARNETIWAAARVVRRTGARREDEAPGMALAFTYCSESHRRLLARALLGRPPRLPGARRLPPPLPKRADNDNDYPLCATLEALCVPGDGGAKIAPLEATHWHPHAIEGGDTLPASIANERATRCAPHATESVDALPPADQRCA